MVGSLKSQKRSVMPARPSKGEKSLDSETNAPPVEPDQPSRAVEAKVVRPALIWKPSTPCSVARRMS